MAGRKGVRSKVINGYTVKNHEKINIQILKNKAELDARYQFYSI